MEALAGGFLLGGAAVCGVIGAAGAAVAAKSQGTIGEKAREYGDKVAGVGENLKKMDEDGKHSAKAKELLGSVLSQAKEAAGPLLEKAKESAAPVLSKAKEAAAPVISKAKEAKEDLSKKDWAQMQVTSPGAQAGTAAPGLSRHLESLTGVFNSCVTRMQADAKEQLGKAKEWTKGVVSKAAGGSGAADGPPQ